MGWLNPAIWRTDARYPAIITKVIAQHVALMEEVYQRDGPSALNPLGLISNDAGFPNNDGYTGFGQRTMLARFTSPTTGQFAHVRKQGLLALQMLGKLGESRCAVSGANAAPLTDNWGVLAAWAAGGGGEAAVLVYNSNDMSNDTAPAVTVTPSLTSSGWAPGTNVTLLTFVLNDAVANPSAVWAAAGSPVSPSPALIKAMWAVARLPTTGPPSFAVVGPGGAVALPPLVVPLPGLALVHIVPANPPPPPTPAGLAAWVKPPAASFFAPSQSEVFVRWDCDGPRTTRAPRPTSGRGEGLPGLSTVLGFTLQHAPASTGPWNAVAGVGVEGADAMCAAYHIMDGTAAGFYRVAWVGYGGAVGAWSDPAEVGGWPMPG